MGACGRAQRAASPCQLAPGAPGARQVDQHFAPAAATLGRPPSRARDPSGARTASARVPPEPDLAPARPGRLGAQGAQGTSPEGPCRTAARSAVVLDAASQRRLRTFAGRIFARELLSEWAVHCRSMTICAGPLSQPAAESHCPVEGELRARIGELRDGQAVELLVVSRGWTEEVVAVGVEGCVSCNQQPYITVACDPDVDANAARCIRRWSSLPADQRFLVRGEVRGACPAD